MSALDLISTAVRQRFCADLDVAPVPAGYVVTSGFLLPDGDPLSFYVIQDDEGHLHLEDDGTFLPEAVASGLDLDSGIREQLLRGILTEEGATFDRSDYIVRTGPIADSELGLASMRFVSALIRMRDLSLLSRENVRATFAEDVREILRKELPDTLVLDEEAPRSSPIEPDAVIRFRRNHLKAALVYAAASDVRVLEAVIRHQDRSEGDSPVVAIVDRRHSRVSDLRVSMATNIGLQMAIVHGQEHDWVRRVVEVANANRSSAA